MHRLPKLFSHNRMDSSSGSTAGASSRQGRAKPKKLDRRNAVKNIDYEFSPSTSTSSASYTSEESLRTRSADLYCDRTSFRVDGTDGEFDVICRTFGFSGIDDFQISTEEFETMKIRSSSAPNIFSETFEPISYQKSDISDNNSDSINNQIQGNTDFTCIDRIRANAMHPAELPNRFVDSVKVSEPSFSDSNISRGSTGLRGNGIKGVRPPILAPLSVVVNTYVPNHEKGFCLDEDDEEATEEINRNRSNQEGTCSFSTTSNDDDSSSTTTEPTLSISPNRRFRGIFKDWQKGELLGHGSFGSVYEGISNDGFFFAVKEVCLLDQGEEGKQRILQLEQEIALLSQFQHENIVQYYGTKKDESHLYIFLELVTKGSLLSLYQKYNMRVPQVSAYTRQILRGLKYLHDRNVIHRDIKCANILVHTNGLVKLADFGLAKAVKLNDAKSCKGTAFWMAPEVVRSQWYGLAADIWSLGCTVLEMLTRQFPYSNMECMAALFRIGRGERPFIPVSIPSEARDFILQCLQVEPGSRPTAAQLLDHPFVKGPLPPSSNVVF